MRSWKKKRNKKILIKQIKKCNRLSIEIKHLKANRINPLQLNRLILCLLQILRRKIIRMQVLVKVVNSARIKINLLKYQLQLTRKRRKIGSSGPRPSVSRSWKSIFKKMLPGSGWLRFGLQKDIIWKMLISCSELLLRVILILCTQKSKSY